MSPRRFLGVLGSSLGLFVAAGLLVAHFSLGLAVHTVLSNSMTPAFEAGDRVVTLDTDPQRLHRGDVVLVMTPDMPAPIAHRVRDIKMIADAVSVQTQGDANADPDRWTNLLPGAQVPLVMTVLPAALPGVPSTWGIGIKVLLIGLLGLGVTLLMVLPQWRGRSCDCTDCTTPNRAAPQLPCPSCGPAALENDLLLGAAPPSELDVAPHDNSTTTQNEVPR
jgi:signal peptidase I